MKDREKELKYLLYLENEIIREKKKKVKEIRIQLREYAGEKVLNKKKTKKKIR